MHAKASIGFVSLGCPKALVDSERILTQLKMEGYDIASDYEGADLVVVNTCGFIDSAKAESLQAIGEALQENGKVIVTGCMGGEDQPILAQYPDVLAVTGPQQYEAVMKAVHQHLPIDQNHPIHESLIPPQGIKLTPKHYAYLKISEGCNHSCTFCIIPDLRGKLQSRPLGEVMGEAERLVQSGVRELLVISQDTSAYGLDANYPISFWGGRPVKTRFKELCQTLAELDVWIRLHYVYPYPHVDEIIPLMAEERILPYLDIPFQHASHRVLKAMRRPAHAENTLKRIASWRAACPDITLRSTFIVGFPGETNEDFELLLDWLKEAQLDRVGCFTYSAVDGAQANDLPGAVPEDIKQARWEKFMSVQQEISAAKLQAKIGSWQQVLIDDYAEKGVTGRTAADAPEIDGVVHVPDGEGLQPGDLVELEITGADEYDLVASPEDPDEDW